jgi:hypothetical protein
MDLRNKLGNKEITLYAPQVCVVIYKCYIYHWSEEFLACLWDKDNICDKATWISHDSVAHSGWQNLAGNRTYVLIQ